jgi:RNase P subunit RPR2
MIMGTRTGTTVLGQIRQTCKKCHQNSDQAVTRRKVRFTLFFVPLIPMGTYTVARCGNCGHEQRLNNKEMDALFSKEKAKTVSS